MPKFKDGERVIIFRKTGVTWPLGCDADKDSMMNDRVMLYVLSYSHTGDVKVYTNDRHGGNYRTVHEADLKSLDNKPKLLII